MDGGSLLFKTNILAESGTEQAKTTAETIAKAYNLIGYDAVGVGRRDLAAGLDFLLEIRDKSRFDWLSANIIDKKTGKPHFKPSLSRRLGELKVAVIGLTGQVQADSKLLDGNTIVKSWRDTLPSLIKKLAKKHDFIILLTDLGAGDCRDIAKMYPAINLTIQSGTNEGGQSPIILTDSSILVGTGGKGKYIGAMEVDWRPGAKWRSADHEVLIKKKNEENRIQRQINQLKDRPELKHQYETLRKRLASVENIIARLERKESFEAANISSYSNKFMAMNVSLPDHPAVLELIKENKKLINEMNRKSPPFGKAKGAVPGRGFTGWTACGNCHREQVKTWQSSRHAASYLTLVEKEQQFNLECLPCHVTGADREDPAAAMGIAADRQAVGCESCHGPGSIHSADPAGQRPAPVTARICLTCHTPEQDDSFNFAGALKKLKCKK